MKQINEQEVNRLLEIEKKYRKVQERSKYYTQRRNARISILLRKCEETGITVEEKEIDQYLESKNTK